jgi:hypothetical protein
MHINGSDLLNDFSYHPRERSVEYSPLSASNWPPFSIKLLNADGIRLYEPSGSNLSFAISDWRLVSFFVVIVLIFLN